MKKKKDRNEMIEDVYKRMFKYETRKHKLIVLIMILQATATARLEQP